MLKDLVKYAEVNQATLPQKGYRGLNVFGKIKFYQILKKNDKILIEFYKEALSKKECYIGPFIGEFGNFLLHILPFISHLYKQGVKVHFCGSSLLKPFLVDENNNSILVEFFELRDFLKEVKPLANSASNFPSDIESNINIFVSKAKQSNIPFLDIYSNHNLYWYSFRNWQLNQKQFIYNLEKVYGSGYKKNKAVVFPRKMSVDFTSNNGGKWNFNEIGEMLLNFFEEVVFIGHPELSDNNKSDNNKIRFSVTGNNEDVLRECASAKLIVTQHSGAMHVGGYVNTPVLLIFKGTPPIKGLDDSIRYRINFDYQKVDIVFSLIEIESYLKEKRNE